MSAMTKQQRLDEVNRLIKIISTYGRRFFYCQSKDRVAHMSLGPRGHIYFHDDYTGKAIYTAYRHRWSGFSHGGTMRDLVCALSEYIRSGKQLSMHWIGPERHNLTDGNIWGYAADQMELCRAEAMKTSVIKQPEPA